MNKDLLDIELKKRRISVEELCNVGLFSRSSYYRKCSGVSEFTRVEIQRIVEFLELSAEQAMSIFFDTKVS